ncbi:MAG: phenylacetate-CoA oxygenase subunit PaaJ [Actinomycetia bacterium]|nr:phenylacetate-CoA oxygenase subunit PaaJ [Actinomycetes bacterium]
MSRSLTPVWEALHTVADPEIPTVSIVALGMVKRVGWDDEGIDIDLVPTFLGCPALDLIRHRVVRAVAQAAGLSPEMVRVRWCTEVPWTSDRIRTEAHGPLRRMGIAPPPEPAEAGAGEPVPCPYCGSRDTRQDNAFGSTACRSLHYCRACRNPFEAMKPV